MDGGLLTGKCEGSHGDGKSPLSSQFGKDWLGQSSVDAKLMGRFGTEYFHGLKDLPQRSSTSSEGSGRIQTKSRMSHQN